MTERDFPTNRGGLCQKGWAAAELLGHPERLRTPLIRDGRDAPLRAASWDEALNRITAAIGRAQAGTAGTPWGSLPVMGVGLAHDYPSFLAFRLAIGAIGASFVITQYHTSAMFAPNIVGTANATAAGWGNLGGGVTQMAMPLLFGTFLVSDAGVGGAGDWP